MLQLEAQLNRRSRPSTLAAYYTISNVSSSASTEDSAVTGEKENIAITPTLLQNIRYLSSRQFRKEHAPLTSIKLAVQYHITFIFYQIQLFYITSTYQITDFSLEEGAVVKLF